MSATGQSLTDTRSAADIEQELVDRASAWLPQWQFDEIPGDFGRALLTIAARMCARVVNGLTRTPEKNQLGLLWWLGIAPAPPQAASMPVFFQLTPTAAAVTAPEGTRLQASLSQPTIFETLDDVRVVPGTVAALVGANPATDQYFMPSAGFLTAGQPPNSQSQWTTLAPASYPPTTLQLSSANGLAIGQVLVIAGRQFRVTAIQSNVVTLSAPGPAEAGAPVPPASLGIGTEVDLLDLFAPFDPTALGAQEHSLLLGDDALLNLTGPATIDVLVGGGALPATLTWSYWSPTGAGTTPGWAALTADTSTSGVVTLSKSAGASASTQFGGITTRWLRANLPGISTGTVNLSSIELRVRSGTGSATSPCPDSSKSAAAFLKYNAMWNNTPIVTSPGFLPLGPMPRMLDSFYVGCAEAFGKPGACVTLCIDVASSSAEVLAAWRQGSMLFGVGKDGRLQRFGIDATTAAVQFLDAAQPREHDVAPGRATANPIPLQVLATRPPVIGISARSAAVLVSSRHRVWMWTERQAGKGFWTPLGELPTPIEALLTMNAARGVRVVALTEGRLQYFDFQPDHPTATVQWQDLPAPSLAGGGVQRIRMIAPVHVEAGRQSDSLVGVTETGYLWRYDGGKWDIVEAFVDTIDPTVAPLAVEVAKSAIYVVKLKDRAGLGAWRSDSDSGPVSVECALASGFEMSGGTHSASDLVVLMLAKDEGHAPCVCWWRPFGAAGAEYLFSQRPPAGPRPLAGTPTVIGDRLVTAGIDDEVFVSRLQPEAHFILSARDISSVALMSAEGPELHTNCLLARIPADKARTVSRVSDVQVSADRSRIVSLDERISRPDSVTAFRLLDISTRGEARPETARAVVIEAGGTPINRGDLVMLGRLDDQVVSNARLYDVGNVSATPEGVHIELDRDLHLSERVHAWVVRLGESIPSTVRPALPTPGFFADEVAAAHPASDEGAVYALDSEPQRQEVALHVGGANPFIVLAANWKRAPRQKLVFDRLVLDSAASSPPSTDTPSLQWQYWNGASWTPIPGVQDNTLELTQTNTVTFKVPSDLTTTRVAGKTDAWVRACLMSGNYGLESFTVTSTTAADGTTTYTAVPNDNSVNPPQLNSIDISYQVCQAQAPAYVVTYDNGSYNDQSDANRAGATAVVRAFVPLADALDSAPTAAGMPALFLGFDQPIDPGPISLLWEVDEQDFGALLPLEVAAVGASGQLIQLNCGDHTRAVGQTQILTVELSVPLIQVNLFGQSLYWLRLQPARPGNWSPRIEAVYLNGTWVAAQETQEMEVLGSSIGAPEAQFSLLRPPVLDGTLELRVQETLSDADRTQLMLGDPDRVLTIADGFTGDWVLWEAVSDTSTSKATDRVYTLDETLGVITFGDGVHGMIPPVGRNNIVAFIYLRGGGAAGNEFTPWGSLSLVSPVQGVSTVLAPEAAAGGSDATPADSLVRIAPAEIAQRDRAITARDIEQISLLSSPDIVQARAWTASGSVRVAVLVGGDDVAPSLAQLRALTSYLKARATPGLGAALNVVAPRLVTTRIQIEGNIATFDDAAQVGSDVESALEGLFDPQTGGVDGTGWPLGRAPMIDDIVAALNDVENLTAIVSVTLESVDSQGDPSSMPASFAPDQFPVLIDSGVQFTAQAEVA